MVAIFNASKAIGARDVPPGVLQLPMPMPVGSPSEIASEALSLSGSDTSANAPENHSQLLAATGVTLHEQNYPSWCARGPGLLVMSQQAMLQSQRYLQMNLGLRCRYQIDCGAFTSRILSLEVELAASRTENETLRAANRALVGASAFQASQPIFLNGEPLSMTMSACWNTPASVTASTPEPVDAHKSQRSLSLAALRRPLSPPPGSELPRCPGSSDIVVTKFTCEFRETVKVSWRVPRLSAQLRSLMGRTLVSGAASLWGCDDVRFMMQAGPTDRMPRTKQEKEMYQKLVQEGPLNGSLQLKMPSALLGPHEYWVTIGSYRSGPFRHCFSEALIATWHEPQLDWIKELQGDGSLQICVEIKSSDPNAAHSCTRGSCLLSHNVDAAEGSTQASTSSDDTSSQASLGEVALHQEEAATAVRIPSCHDASWFGWYCDACGTRVGQRRPRSGRSGWKRQAGRNA